MSIRVVGSLFVILFGLCIMTLCSAKDNKDNNGGIPVRIPNAPDPDCINSSTDQVWLTLYRVIETKKNGFFTKENQAEIVVTVKVEARPQPTGDPLSFPLSKKVNIRPYGQGQVSLPVEYTLVSGLALTQPDDKDKTKQVKYTGFGVDATIVNLKSANGVGSALQALSEMTGDKKLPIPDNPYSQAGTYLLGFATKAIQKDIDNKNADDKYSTASLALNFSDSASCKGGGPTGQGFETTGTKAILMAEGVRGDGYVPIDQTNGYCWAADVTPSFVLKAAKISPGKACTDSSYASQYREVTNDYIAFFLQKQTAVGGHLGANKVLKRDLTNAQRLCDALGVTECPAAKAK
jgi:hypothetical protein